VEDEGDQADSASPAVIFLLLVVVPERGACAKSFVGGDAGPPGAVSCHSEENVDDRVLAPVLASEGAGAIAL